MDDSERGDAKGPRNPHWLELHQTNQAFAEGRINDAQHTMAVEAVLRRLTLRQNLKLWLDITWFNLTQSEDQMLAYYRRQR